MNNLAIIPARGGSKRIKRKNIKDFYGKPLISYSISTALKSKLFDDVMVSTDDPAISEISDLYGASVPFYRSAINSSDSATTVDVILEVIKNFRELKNLDYDNICCIYPTAPLLSIKVLVDSYYKFIEDKYDSFFPIVRFSYPIQRGLIYENGKVRLRWPEFINSRSQDLEPLYHDAGQFYWIKTSAILKEKRLWTNNSGAIIMDELNVQDIDNETDWILAELKYRYLNELE